MSTMIMPDLYRHTARKSTVSKNVKPINVSPCNFNDPPTTYPAYHQATDSSDETIFNTLQCDIKLENDLIPLDQPFLLLPDNETEEMSIGDERDSDIVHQLIEEIIQSIEDTSPSTPNQIERNVSVDSEDVHHVVNSMINQFDPIDEPEFSSDHIEENGNTSSDEMESDQPASTTSRSQTEDDVVEIEAVSNQNSPHLCSCQCHKPSSPLNNEYLLFEQALKQTRLEQQQEKSLTNNRLIQTLKRQHEELVNIYQQSQKQTQKKTIDREQQTTKYRLHDSQMQTDIITMNQTKIISPQKSTNNSHPNGSLTATRNHTISSNSNQTSPSTSSSSSSSAIKTATRLPNNEKITTTIATSTTANKTTVPSLPLPTSTTVTSPDVVDLTEEDEEDTTNRASSTQRTAPVRQSTSSTHPPTSTTATTTRARPPNPLNRPPNPPISGQVFPLRPLPEHTPCDQTIARPQLSITQENASVRLTWTLPSTPMESIQNYEIYAYKQTATATTSDWKKIGSVKSMRLPMAVTLKEFQSNSHYAFAVRAVSTDNRIGPFCEPKTIFTGNSSIQPLHTSQLLNVSS